MLTTPNRSAGAPAPELCSWATRGGAEPRSIHGFVHFWCFQFWLDQGLSEASKVHLNWLYNADFSFLLQNAPLPADFCIKKRNKTMHNLTFFKQWNEFWCRLTENSLSILCFHWNFSGLYQLKAFASHLLTDKVKNVSKAYSPAWVSKLHWNRPICIKPQSKGTLFAPFKDHLLFLHFCLFSFHSSRFTPLPYCT